MIEGVKVKKLVKHCDDRGFFAELVRDDEPELLSNFGQASWSMSYPGVIKAFIIMKNRMMYGFSLQVMLKLSFMI